MIEKNLIREKYASISDSELMSFAQHEGHQITEEAAILLVEELKKRKLSNPGHEGENKSGEEYLQNSDHFFKAYWPYVFDQKENRKTNEVIIAGLVELGMEEQQANELILLMDSFAKQRLKQAELERLVGSLILICGIAITFLPLSMPANKLTYIIAWCAIIAGSLKLTKGFFGIARFKKIIKNISLEK